MRFFKRVGPLAASAVLLAGLGVSAGDLAIKNGKVAVTSPDGLSDATYK